MKYTREILKQAAHQSISMREVMRNLGIVKPSGGMHAHLRRRIDKLDIDISHFKGQARNAGIAAKNRLRPDELLVVLPPGTNRPQGTKLKRALLEIGTSYACRACDLGGEWQGKPITLHVDHINGEFLDCRVENLRFLCPNCHSQTENFAGRSLRRMSKRSKAKSAPANIQPRWRDGPRVPKIDPRRFENSKQKPEKIVRMIEFVEKGDLKVYEAVEEIGCSLTTFYRLRERYLRSNTIQFGSVARPRVPWQHKVARDRLILEAALRDPDLGPAKIAQMIRSRQDAAMEVSENTAYRVLQRYDLSVQDLRWKATMSPLWKDASRQTWAKPTLSALGGALATACESKARHSGILPVERPVSKGP